MKLLFFLRIKIITKELMNKAPRQKRAEIQRLTSISNLRTKQLSSSAVGKRGHEEPDRIEHFDLELRPSKLHDLKVGEFISGGDR
ncbi:hypothetical protein I4U23_025943 [Adineta vaga]|nr:hypothetical protein I4U23_025943 [Adineta vaga]